MISSSNCNENDNKRYTAHPRPAGLATVARGRHRRSDRLSATVFLYFGPICRPLHRHSTSRCISQSTSIFISSASPDTSRLTHLIIHLSGQLCHHHHSQHPFIHVGTRPTYSLSQSRLMTYLSEPVRTVYTSLHQRWTSFPAFSNIWRSARAKDVNVNIRTSQFRRLRT